MWEECPEETLKQCAVVVNPEMDQLVNDYGLAELPVS